MFEIPVLNTKGEKVGSESLDPAVLGGKIRYELLKQAVVVHRANLRVGTVKTKSRGMVAGSTRKLYRQKGTGRARSGPIRTPVKKGGGRAFAKINRDLSMAFPRHMRRLARNSAVLAKAKAGSAVILKGLAFSAPKTKEMAQVMKAIQAPKGALIATTGNEPNMVKSGRNIPNLRMKPVWEVSAYDVLRHPRLVFTPEAYQALMADPETAGRPAESK